MKMSIVNVKAATKIKSNFMQGSVLDDEYKIFKFVLLWTACWPGLNKFVRLILYVANLTVNVELISRKASKQYLKFVFSTI